VLRAAVLFVAIAACTGLALATDITSEWAGVYKERFPNGLVTGETYESENVLEIVRLDAESAYVRATLQFYNGHSCSIYGVARVEGESLVYHVPATPGDRERCMLTLTRVGDAMRFGDANGACQLRSCGARGSFEGIEMPVSSRRRIRYMTRLRASREFAAAIQEAGLER
jgi:hypothetical protein